MLIHIREAPFIYTFINHSHFQEQHEIMFSSQMHFTPFFPLFPKRCDTTPLFHLSISSVPSHPFTDHLLRLFQPFRQLGSLALGAGGWSWSSKASVSSASSWLFLPYKELGLKPWEMHKAQR